MQRIMVVLTLVIFLLLVVSRLTPHLLLTIILWWLFRAPTKLNFFIYLVGQGYLPQLRLFKWQSWMV